MYRTDICGVRHGIKGEISCKSFSYSKNIRQTLKPYSCVIYVSLPLAVIQQLLCSLSIPPSVIQQLMCSQYIPPSLCHPVAPMFSIYTSLFHSVVPVFSLSSSSSCVLYLSLLVSSSRPCVVYVSLCNSVANVLSSTPLCYSVASVDQQEQFA